MARFIAITEAVREALLAGGIAADRIALVHPGVAAPTPLHTRSWREECSWPSDSVVTGIVGRLTETSQRRALEELLATFDEATRHHLALVLLGGPSSGHTEIAGIPAYRAGFVHDVPAALAGLELILHPGGAEGLGSALVEAMALQVPAVAFAAGGVGEIIAHDATGLLVPPGDTDGFARAVARLVADPDRRQALGAAGPAQAARFSAESMLAGTLAVYSGVLPKSVGLPAHG